MEMAQMELTQTDVAQMEIARTRIPTHTPPNPVLARALARIFTRTLTRALAAARLKLFWRSVVCRAGSKRKTLAVRETAALGDHRFVCVIQFEHQRFLIGSSPSAVTLLSQLPDESVSGEQGAEQLRKQPGERN
jgi:hypothetical protein